MVDPLKFDESQLKQILGTLASEKPKQWSISTALAALQFLAILGAAAWGLYEYLAFRKEHEALQLQKMQFEREQQSVLKEQQQIALHMAKLSTISIEGKNRLQEIELRSKVNERIERTADDLTVVEIQEYDDGTRLYKLTLSAGVKNISDTPVEISWTVIEYFVGELPEGVPSKRSIFRIDPLPRLLREPAEDSIWTRVGWDAHVLATTKSDLEWLRNYEPEKGGGMTAHLAKEEESFFAYEYILRANPNELVGFTLNFAVSSEENDGGLAWYFSNFKLLSEVD